MCSNRRSSLHFTTSRRSPHTRLPQRHRVTEKNGLPCPCQTCERGVTSTGRPAAQADWVAGSKRCANDRSSGDRSRSISIPATRVASRRPSTRPAPLCLGDSVANVFFMSFVMTSRRTLWLEHAARWCTAEPQPRRRSSHTPKRACHTDVEDVEGLVTKICSPTAGRSLGGLRRSFVTGGG
jgi:hypothetical protein